MKTLPKIGDYVAIDEFTEAPVERYVFPRKLSRSEYKYDWCWQDDQGNWVISHPTNLLGAPVRLYGKDLNKITYATDYSKMRSKRTKLLPLLKT